MEKLGDEDFVSSAACLLRVYYTSRVVGKATLPVQTVKHRKNLNGSTAVVLRKAPFMDNTQSL